MRVLISGNRQAAGPEEHQRAGTSERQQGRDGLCLGRPGPGVGGGHAMGPQVRQQRQPVLALAAAVAPRPPGARLCGWAPALRTGASPWQRPARPSMRDARAPLACFPVRAVLARVGMEDMVILQNSTTVLFCRISVVRAI